MSDNDYDIIPFSEAKTLLLEDAATLAASGREHTLFDIQPKKTFAR